MHIARFQDKSGTITFKVEAFDANRFNNCPICLSQKELDPHTDAINEALYKYLKGITPQK